MDVAWCEPWCLRRWWTETKVPCVTRLGGGSDGLRQRLGCGLGGQPHVPASSIWVTMIPRYSFPAAQQAQISEYLLAHARAF